MRWVPRAALRPFGPRRRRHAPDPGTGRAAGGSQRTCANRARRTMLRSSRQSSIEPRKITVKSAPRALQAMAQAALLMR